MKNDENFDFYFKNDPRTLAARYEEFRHFFRVRIPYEGDENEVTRRLINERAEVESTKEFDTDTGYRSLFDLKEGFFRGSLDKDKDKDYRGYGFFKYKGRFLDPDIIYNAFNFQAYD